MTRLQRFMSTRMRGDVGAVNFQTEPVTLMGAINAAIASTIGILTLSGVIEPEVGGSIGAALGAWILVASLLITRPNVASPVTIEALQAKIAELQATSKPGK